MIRINLLPYREAARKENLKRQISILAGSFIVFFLLMVLGKISLSSSIGDLEKNVQQKEDRLVVLKKKLGDIEGLKRDTKELEQKLAVINRLEENRLFPVHLLEEMARLVPNDDIWLEKVSTTGAELQIEGVARNNVVAARYMKQLELSKLVSSVSLVSTKRREISGYELQQFTFSCVLKKG